MKDVDELGAESMIVRELSGFVVAEESESGLFIYVAALSQGKGMLSSVSQCRWHDAILANQTLADYAA
jgi:hypothetical protein